MSQVRNVLRATIDAEAQRRLEREKRLRERWERLTLAEREEILRQIAERQSAA